MRLTIQGKKNSDSSETAPTLIISTSGDITPFVIWIGKQNATPLYKIIGDASGRIHYQKIENNP
jgi:hypothetical protein